MAVHTSALPAGGTSQTARSVARRMTSRFWIALVPALVLYTVFTLYPMAQVIVSSVTDANGFTGDSDFVGVDNFVKMFTRDEALLAAMGNTGVYAFFRIVVQTALAFGIAVLLNAKLRGISVYRAVFFAPIVVSPVAIVFTWSFMFDPTTGTINTTLHDLGLGFLAQDWLGDFDLALYSVILVDIWASIGFSIVIFLAGLGTIPSEVLEAARVDGATGWRSLVHVTVPLMRPAFGLVLVLAVNGALRAFDTVYLMTQGGPGGATELYMTRVFAEGFVKNHFGYASSMAVVVVVVLIGIAYLQNRFEKEMS